MDSGGGTREPDTCVPCNESGRKRKYGTVINLYTLGAVTPDRKGGSRNLTKQCWSPTDRTPLDVKPEDTSERDNPSMDGVKIPDDPEQPIDEVVKDMSRMDVSDRTKYSAHSPEATNEHSSPSETVVIEATQIEAPYGPIEEKVSKYRWSIGAIQKQFEAVHIEDLYRRYWLRLQRGLLFKLLIVISIYGLLVLILFNIPQNKRSSSSYRNLTLDTYSSNGRLIKPRRDYSQLWVNITLCVALLIASMSMILVLLKDVFFKLSNVITILVWLYLLALLYAFAPLASSNTSPSDTGSDAQSPMTPMDNVPMTFYSIFVIHTMLPTTRRLASVLGVLTSLVDLVVVAILYKPNSLLWKLTPLFTNAVIYLCANLTGLYHKHLTDLAHRHTFWDSRHSIEAGIRYSRQREQQMKMKEALLLKVIPRHLLEDMKKITYKKIAEMGHAELEQSHQSCFYNLYVDRYDEVSILYADIVNFTPLTERLGSNVLVEVLNQLFGRFDNMARDNQCMRIKMLGDCYYCVSGLPDPVENHARNCVIMGLQMIHIIRNLREETGVDDLDMRIGINSGFVLSGVLGLKKWQYDVWSDDVTVANHMEATGRAGKVHITLQTLNKLGGEFEVTPADGAERSDYLKENQIQTFFIADHELDRKDIQPAGSRKSSVKSLHKGHPLNEQGMPGIRRISMAECVEHWGAEKPFDSLSDYMMERSLPEMTEVNKQLERGFDLDRSQDGGKGGQGLGRHEQIHPVTLRFRDRDLEREYESLRDASFKFYIICAFIIFLFMVVVQILILAKRPALYGAMLAIGMGFLLLVIFTTGLKCLPCFSAFPVACSRRLRCLAEVLISNKWCKMALSFVSCALIFVASILPPVLDCQYYAKVLQGQPIPRPSDAPLNISIDELWNLTLPTFTMPTLTLPALPGENITTGKGAVDDFLTCGDDRRCCLFAPYYLFSCMLALISCSVFLRVPYVIKSFYMIVGLVVFNVMFYYVFEDIFRLYDILIRIDFLKTNLRGSLYTGVLCLTLIVLDRQIGTNLRLDFLCKVGIQREEEEVRRNDEVNQVLMDNILPRHVADYFTRPDRSKKAIYHERCRGACVMFAAIPNFNLKTFFSSVDVTGKECLRLLNEIISAFDLMVMSKRFQGVEKIKTIGSTYMAAVGLHDKANDGSREQAIHHVVLMVKFALAMMRKLEPISRDAFGNYKLRIGINHGDVVAGVVGAQKPQYDIWGDVVNVASRMESSGVTGAIQVPEATAELLKDGGVPCIQRGRFKIKGKAEPMELYLVDEKKVVLQRIHSLVSETDSIEMPY